MYYSYVSYHLSLNLHFKFLSHNPILLSPNLLLFANLLQKFSQLLTANARLMENFNYRQISAKITSDFVDNNLHTLSISKSSQELKSHPF